ncbi:MAG TPA: glycosyltransferase, partial [Chthonomonadales bacterium]|nr:glycosyltransferase [Chthonomonadales bacterium]
GPTDDFVNEAVGWRIPAERKLLGKSKVGEWDCCGPTWMLEVDSTELAHLLRKVAADPSSRQARGAAAAERARASWTWQHTIHAALACLDRQTANSLRRSTASRAARAATRRRPPSSQNWEEGSGEEGLARRPWNEGHRPVPRISCCIIAKNEAKVITQCLQSIKPYVHETIVVDTGSTEQTVSIAERTGAQVHQIPWPDSFAAARNESVRYAAGDWIFWMDADDTIMPECAAQLKELAFLAEDTTYGFIIPVRFPPPPGAYTEMVVDHVKLYRNLPELKWEHRIHEQILNSIYKAGGEVARSNVFVDHTNYDYSAQGQERKRNRDLPLLDLDEADDPSDPFAKFNKGMTFYHLKRYPEAIESLNQSLALSKPWESTVRKVYALLAGCRLELGDMDNARLALEEGLMLFERDPELLFRMASLYHRLGDLPAAERAYRKLRTDGAQGHLDSIDRSILTYKACHNLGIICQQMGRLAEAEAEYRAALGFLPTFEPSLAALRNLAAGKSAR